MPFRSLEDLVREGVGLPPKVSTGEDVLRGSTQGLRNAAAGTVGMFGDIQSLGTMAANKFADVTGIKGARVPQPVGGAELLAQVVGAGGRKLGLDPRLSRLATTLSSPTSVSAAPTSAQVKGALQHDKPDYKPQTKAGKYARAVAEFAPAAALPGGPIRKLANVIAPAVSSETAGQVTEGTPFEPYARVAGGMLGGGVAAMVGRPGPASTMLAEASRGATDAHVTEARALMEAAQGQGVQLTMSEALQQVTNGGTGMGRLQRVLEGTKAGSERIGPVMSQRPGQVRTAVTNYADALAPATDQPSMIGAQSQQAADSGLTGVRRFINHVAEPNYRALEGQTVPAADYARLAQNPSYAEALAGLRGHPEIGAQVAHLPDENMAVVNEVVKRLNTGAEQARPGPMNPMGDNGLAALRDQGAGLASEIGTAASPEYAAARQGVAAGRQEYLEPLQRGPLGAVANTPDVKQQTAALFPTQPLEGAPAETGRAMSMLQSQDAATGPALARQHLMNGLNESTQDLQGGMNQYGGARYAAAIAGNPEQERTLMAGVGAAGGNTDELTSVLRTLRATGKRQAPGSLTAYNSRDLEELGKMGAIGEVARTGLNPPGIFRRLGQGLQDWQTETNAGRLADALIADPAQAEQILMRARQVVPQGQALDTIERLAISAQQSRQSQAQPQLEGR